MSNFTVFIFYKTLYKAIVEVNESIFRANKKNASLSLRWV